VIDINNESGISVDEKSLVLTAAYVLKELRIHPQVDLSILLVDEPTMAHYHETFMDLPGPTDVLSFPMDELRVPKPGQPAPTGILGDIVLCPAVTIEQASEHGRAPADEAEYLLVHGLLHLLGYDHATQEEHDEMFALNDRLIRDWNRARAKS